MNDVSASPERDNELKFILPAFLGTFLPLVIPFLLYLFSVHIFKKVWFFRNFPFAAGLHPGEKYLYLALLGSWVSGALLWSLSELIGRLVVVKLKVKSIKLVIFTTGLVLYILPVVVIVYAFSASGLLGTNWLIYAMIWHTVSFLVGLYSGKALLIPISYGGYPRELLLLGGFVAICYASALWGVTPYDSLREASAFTLGIVPLSFAYATAKLIRCDGKFEDELCSQLPKLVSMIFLQLLLISLIIAIAQVYSGGLSEFTSIFFQRDVFSSYLLLLLPFALLNALQSHGDESSIILKYQPIAILIGILITLSILLMTSSRASLLALTVASPLYVGLTLRLLKPRLSNRYEFRKVLISGIVLSGLGISLLLMLSLRMSLQGVNPLELTFIKLRNMLKMSDTSLLARLEFWRAGIQIFSDNFLKGVGLYGYSQVYPLYQTNFLFYSKDPHNFYIQLLAETGLLGLTCWILFVGSILYRGFKILSRTSSLEDNRLALLYACLISIFQESVRLAADVDFKFVAIYFTFMTITGLALGLCEELEQRGRGSENKGDTFSIRVHGIALLAIWGFLIFPGLLGWAGLRGQLEAVKLEELAGEVKTGDVIELISDEMRALRRILQVDLMDYKLLTSYINFIESVLYSEDIEKAEMVKLESFAREAYKLSERFAPYALGDDLIYANILRRVGKVKLALKMVTGTISKDPYNIPLAYTLLLDILDYSSKDRELYLWSRHILKVRFPPYQASKLMPIKQAPYGQLLSYACLNLIRLKPEEADEIIRDYILGLPFRADPSLIMEAMTVLISKGLYMESAQLASEVIFKEWYDIRLKLKCMLIFGFSQYRLRRYLYARAVLVEMLKLLKLKETTELVSEDELNDYMRNVLSILYSIYEELGWHQWMTRLENEIEALKSERIK